MRRPFLVALALGLLVLATPLLTAAQEDPGALLTKLTALDNAKDEPGLVALFAPDAVIVSPSPDALDKTATYSGTERIRDWVKLDTEGDAKDDRTEVGAIAVQGDTARAPFKVYSNDPQMKQAGLEPILGTVELTATGGKVARLTIALDPGWMNKAAAAMGPAALPTTGQAPDLLPLTLAAGLGLLGIGLVVRRTRRAA